MLGLDMSDQEAGNAETTAGSLSDVERMMRYDASKKSTLMAYVIWLFSAGLAGHRFYLRRYGSAVLMLLFSVVVIVLIIGAVVSSTLALDEMAEAMFVIAVIVSIVPIIWIFVDLFLIPGIARRYNNDLIDRLQR